MSLKDARQHRDNARKLLADGIDPGENRKAMKAATGERAANSFEVVAREWFAKNSPTWASNHGDRIIRRPEKDIFPWLGGKPIADITAPQLLAVMRRIEERAQWKPRTVPLPIADRYSAMPLQLGAPNATPPLTSKAHCRLSNKPTLHP